MIQEILVILVVGASLYYLGKKFYSQFFSKKHKCMGCAVYKLRS